MIILSALQQIGYGKRAATNETTGRPSERPTVMPCALQLARKQTGTSHFEARRIRWLCRNFNGIDVNRLRLATRRQTLGRPAGRPTSQCQLGVRGFVALWLYIAMRNLSRKGDMNRGKAVLRIIPFNVFCFGLG